MKQTDTNTSSRREFLRSAGRAGALGGLAVLGAALLGRASGSASCGGGELCGSCDARRSCSLPQARKPVPPASESRNTP